MTCSIHRISAFHDNYLWLVVDNTTNQALVVDPGDAAPVAKALQAHGANLAAIVLTHHHADHIGGVDALVASTGAAVYGPLSQHIPQVTHLLHGGQRVRILGLEFDVIDVPGHTLDHIAYFSRDAGPQPILFCGDTLFAGGCGRTFEGTAAQMTSSLDKLAALPGDTLVYCAHEYTLANLRFATAVEPDNRELLHRLETVEALRAANQPTVPSRLDTELATNPFLRCHLPLVARAATQWDATSGTGKIATFAAIRRWKDQF